MDELVFECINWKCKRGIRRVIPKEIWYGHTEWHKEDQ